MLPTKYDQMLDLTAVAAPMPLLLARRALKTMHSGQVLRVLATGAAVSRDFHDFAKLTGNSLRTELCEDGKTEFFIQKR